MCIWNVLAHQISVSQIVFTLQLRKNLAKNLKTEKLTAKDEKSDPRNWGLIWKQIFMFLKDIYRLKILQEMFLKLTSFDTTNASLYCKSTVWIVAHFFFCPKISIKICFRVIFLADSQFLDSVRSSFAVCFFLFFSLSTHFSPSVQVSIKCISDL